MKQRLDTRHSKGVKHDQGKTRYDLLPWDAIERVASIFTFGAQKYGDRNWERGIHSSRLFASAQRHLSAYWTRHDLDPEWDQEALAHAIAALLMLLALKTRKSTPRHLDDRPKKR